MAIKRINRRRFWFAALVMFGALAACTQEPRYKSTDVTGAPFGGDFFLTAHTGQRLDTATLRGKVLVVFFGYTHCPDICGPTLAKAAMAVKRLEEQANDVRVLFVTVAPKHDTPEALAKFVPKFHPDFIGLTGTEAEIAAVVRDYKIAAAAAPGSTAGEPRIDHTGSLFVRDRQGRLRLLVPNDVAVEDLAHDLRLMLKERG